jgi:hypothetical protein
MRARDDDGPDTTGCQPLELSGDALDGPPRLHVAVEQITRDQDQIGLLGDRQIDGGGESCELALALGARLLTEVVMACAKVDVRGVDDP